MDGAMMTEVPMADEPPLEAIADNLLVGDAETVAERLTAELRAARPAHVMFHFQVGGSSHAAAMDSMEVLMTRIKPMVEAELGPLESFGAPRPSAAAA